MAGVTGLEPATSGVTGRRSNQLSYTPAGVLLRGRRGSRVVWAVKYGTYPGKSSRLEGEHVEKTRRGVQPSGPVSGSRPAALAEGRSQPKDVDGQAKDACDIVRVGMATPIIASFPWDAADENGK